MRWGYEYHNDIIKILGLATEYKMIPIGLYRRQPADKEKKNQKPYVFLNPPPYVKIGTRDKIYVLSVKQPRECKYLILI